MENKREMERKLEKERERELDLVPIYQSQGLGVHIWHKLVMRNLFIGHD